jgi:hypothetical protein
MKTASKAMAAIIGAVVKLGGKGEDVDLVLDHDDLCQQVAKAIVEFSRKIFQLVIDCSLSLVDLIALGKFDYMNTNITDTNFSSVKGHGKRKVTVELWHPGKNFNNGDEVIAELAKAMPGYRFANLRELLVLAIAQPELQRLFPIAALGSIWSNAGCRYFAFLYRYGSERYLDLCRLEFDFDGSWRVAVVREQS